MTTDMNKFQHTTPTQSIIADIKKRPTRNDAKCSDVMTALKPTTGTRAARRVPNTTCNHIHSSCSSRHNREIQWGTSKENWTLPVTRNEGFWVPQSSTEEFEGIYQGGISNIKACWVAPSDQTCQHMDWNKVDDECVSTPWTDLWQFHLLVCRISKERR